MTNNFNEAKALFEKGVEELNQNRLESAKLYFLKSLNLLPGRSSTISNLIKIYFLSNDANGLEIFLLKKENINNSKELIIGRSILFYLKDKLSESYETLKSINLTKNDLLYYEVNLLMAMIMVDKQDFINAISIFRKLLKENKNDWVIYNNIGKYFTTVGKAQLAKKFYQKSFKLNKSDNLVAHNLATSMIKLSEFKDGFKLYESRRFLKLNNKDKFYKYNLPSSLVNFKDKSIVIFEEQGIGDVFQFTRFIKLLTKYSKDISFYVRKNLIPFYQNIVWDVKVLNITEITKSESDYYIPIMSLPNFFDLETDKIPFEEINLKKNFIPNDKLFDQKKLNIGFSYQGNPNYKNDNYRSISAKYFLKYLKDKTINFFQISQLSIFKEDYLTMLSCNNIKRLDEIPFDLLYGYLKKLDLIFTTDTSIAHYCGILNIPAYLLLNYNSHWNWLEDTYKSQWYPSITIIKQKKLNDWTAVIDIMDQIIENKKIKLTHNIFF